MVESLSNVITLSVSGGLPGNLALGLQRSGHAVPPVEHRVDLSLQELAKDPSRLGDLVPLSVLRELRQWMLDDPSPGLLAVTSAHSDLDGIPWEVLPQVCQLPSAFVVRTLNLPEPSPVAARRPPHILAAGWSGKPWLQLPGIQRELNALSQVGVATDVRWRVLSEPLPGELAEAYREIRPLVLHLVAAAIRSENRVPEMLLSGSEEPHWMGVQELLSLLPNGHPPRLVVLNSCNSGDGGHGISAARLVTTMLGSVAVGWLDVVDDLAAVDFALFFYNRLMEGMSVVDAARSYLSLQLSKAKPIQLTRDLATASRDDSLLNIPVIWARSLAALRNPLPLLGRYGLETEMSDRGAGPADATSVSSLPVNLQETVAAVPETRFSSLRVEMEFEPQKWLNPALLKNGRSAITQLTLKPDQPLNKVSVVVSCDTGSGSSTVRQMIDLQRGHHPINVDKFEFPILHQLIKDDVSRRRINFTVSCSKDGVLLAETTSSALWMGCAEWLDRPDTWHFIPAFVQPNSEGVLDVIDKAIPILKTLVSPQSSFSGYQDENDAFVTKQVEAVFNCLRSECQLNYINPPPLLVYKPGDRASSGQQVRWPKDVIERRRGTCHDLAILIASCLEHVGIYPLIILVHGHTFVGYWRGTSAHQDFWEAARKDIKRQSSGLGRAWTITDAGEIQRLVNDGLVDCLEATLVTSRNETFASATKKGRDRLITDTLDVAVDVQASRHEIQPL